MIRTKTREGAKVSSREANFLEYKQHTGISDNPVVGNTNDLGTVGTEQSTLGVWYPTVQAAIEDLNSLLIGNIGDVTINSTGISPQGVQQIGSVKFEGTVEFIDNGETPVTSAVVEILGFPVTFEAGETSDQIAVKFVEAVTPYVDNNKVFAQIEQMSADPSTVQFRHVDYRIHSYSDTKKYGIQMNFEIASPARNGSGTWIKLGQESKTFENATDSVTLHYYKRTS